MNDLIQSLRYHAENVECGDTNINEDLHEAADEIQRLQGEIDKFKEANKAVSKSNMLLRDKLTEEQQRAEAAERERDELAGALSQIKLEFDELAGNCDDRKDDFGNVFLQEVDYDALCKTLSMLPENLSAKRDT